MAVLLLHRAKINICHENDGNALTSLLVDEEPKRRSHLKRRERKSMILFAAGEIINRKAVKAVGKQIREYLQPELSLRDICRRRVREHLLELEPAHTSVRQGAQPRNP